MSENATDPIPKQPTPKGGGAFSAGAWTVVERIISQASQLVVFIGAARQLSPAEFGVFALVSTCAILLLRVAEVGWAPYIMSWSGDARVPRQVVMVSLYSGLAIGGLGALAGLALPLFGPSVATGHLVILFALWVVLATVSSAQKGVMIWLNGLRASALAEILGDLVGMAVALTALTSGWGVFSLAFGRLAFQSVHLIASFTYTRMAPLRGLRGAELRDLARYSAQIFTSRLIANLRLYVATFLIGGFLGTAEVGYYRAASRLVGAVAEMIVQPAQILAWSLFRRARDSGAGPQALSLQAMLYFTALFGAAIPVFIWLALMGEDIATGLLGAKWLLTAPIVAVLALSRAIGIPGIATEPILSIAGEIRRLPPMAALVLVLTVACTLAGVPFGLMGVAWAQVAVSVVVTAITIRLQARYGGMNWARIARSALRLTVPVILGSATILALGNVPAFATLPPLFRAFGVVIPASAVYSVSLMIALPELRSMAKARLARRRAGT